MKKTIRPIVALALMATLLAMQLTPMIALADDTATSTDPSSAATTTSDTITSQNASSSSQEDAAATTTDATSTNAATSTSDTTIAATSSILDILSGTSTVSQVASDDATSSASGFIPTEDSTTTDASSSDAIPTATSTATMTDASDTTASSSTDAASTTPSTAASTTDSTTDSTADSTAASTTLSAASSSQTIVTGSSLALANILNLLNASFVNSDGSILFANLTDASGTIDLRDGSLFSGLCGAVACGSVQGLEINLVNDATILNQILINANSGQNQISTASSSAAITTGNAYAGLNLINLANVSFVDSNYMIVTLNAFQDVNGDIVFPALQVFLNSLGGTLSNGSTNITNAADVTNTVAASAQSGDNSLTDIASTSAIVSGSSTARLNIFNQINSLLMGNGISVLLNFGGAWSGQIQGLVPGVAVVRTPTSVLISGDDAGAATGTSAQGLALDLTASSTADINNQASIEAQTGSNAITDASSTALITTGNAFSGANIINVANQTVIGRNWLLAIVNVFGNFNGNIDFGRPDLWVGDSASVPSFVQNGSDVTYTITVTNKGDAPADDTQITEQFDAAHLTIATSTVPFTTGANGTMVFSLGTLAPGATQTIVYDATVQNTAPGTTITNSTNATESETDNNTADNTDGTSITASVVISSGGGSSVSFSSTQSTNTPTGSTAQAAATTTLSSAAPANANAQATISVTRTTSTLTSAAGSSVTETIQVQNTGSVTAENVSLNDTLNDPSGTALHTENFDIGELVPRDGVDISYVFNFDTDAPSGDYTLTSAMTGDNIASSTAQNGTIILSTPATVTNTGIVSAPVTFAPAHPFIPAFAPHTMTAISIDDATSTPPAGIPREALLAAAGTIDSPEVNQILIAFLAVVLIGLLGAGIYRKVRA